MNKKTNFLAKIDKEVNQEKFKKEFLNLIIHELRTPLSVIMGFTDLLKSTYLNEKQKHYIESIMSSSNTMMDVINQILDYSLVSTHEIQLEETEFNLEDIVNEAYLSVISKIEYKPIEVYISFRDPVLNLVKGDSAKLKRIITSLIDNAFKFTSRGEVALFVSKLYDKSNDEEITFSFTVKDTGIGIPKEKISTIFEISNSVLDADQYGKSGFSLIITKALIEAMGGTIEVNSNLNEGSEFVFNLKLKQGRKLTKEEIQHIPAGSLKGAKVIIADEHASSRTILNKLCEDFSMNVLVTAQSVPLALEFLENFAAKNIIPDFMLCGVVMPGTKGWMYGYELVNKIKSDPKYKDVRLVAVTSDIRYGAAHLVEEEGYDGCLIKPVSKKDFAKKLYQLKLKDNIKGEESNSDNESILSDCVGVQVLVVEDNSANQELIKSYFELLGCKGDYADNGREAIEMLKKNKYDICLMDVQMPVISGLETTKIIRREISKDLPIIALTAIAEITREECINCGMNDYLAKPVDIDDLKNAILQNVKK